MSRSAKVWILFGLSVVVIAAGMGWMTLTALRLDRREAEAQRLAEDEELIRLALWRMDAALLAVVLQEGARPYSHYRSFFATDEAYDFAGRKAGGGTVLIPSPLLNPDAPQVRLHFRIDVAGRVTSPQVPAGDQRALAERYVPTDKLAAAAERLKTLKAILKPDELLVALPDAPPAVAATQPAQFLSNTNFAFSRGDRYRQTGREFQLRQNVAQAQNSMFIGEQKAWPMRPADVRDGPAQGLWHGEALILARRVVVGGSTLVVGCWLDWPKVRAELLEAVRDILPGADLGPLPSDAAGPEWRRLAALPLLLEPGPMPPPEPNGWSPMMVSLAAAWIGLALGAAAVAGLLAGTLSLSERRGAFVSAVTHELRTPLTTMRMYTEMLSDGRIADEAKAAQYLQTLHAETNRLCRLVENVLAWSRLEGRRKPAEAQRVELGEFLARVGPRLRERAVQARMELVIDAPAGAAAMAEPTALEQVLFNLVDNACKYAASADDNRIHVACVAADGWTDICVRDHGPGIPPADIAKVFRPFFRAGRDQAGSLGGVGLGLAISRRILRSLGGNLLIAPAPDGGAAFTIRLPAA